MVAVFHEEFLRWYIITLKLRETVESVLHNAQTPLLTTSRPLQYPKQSYHQKLEVDDNPRNNSNDNQKGPTSPESEWVISIIKQKLDQARHEDGVGPWAKFCIYRVPQRLQEWNAKAYIPQVVSLGPYHHGKGHLRNMDNHKWRALYHILKRTNQDIKLFLDAMNELEKKARACYEGSITLSSDEFVEMIELFCGFAKGGFKHLGYSRNDPVFAMRRTMISIMHDMIMLENQIPMFILDRLFEIGKWDQEGTVAKLAIGFLDQLMPPQEPLTEKDIERLELSMGNSSAFDPLPEQAALHCLEIFRRCFLWPKPWSHRNRVADKPNDPLPKQAALHCPKIFRRCFLWLKPWFHMNQEVDKPEQRLIHCAMHLKDAGIKFKKRKTGRLWDIQFKNGVLQIPLLVIDDGTKSLFLNLIAFEQSHLDCTNHITSYVGFMDNLINSAEDVSYLHNRCIIEHWLGSDAEVAEMFNRLVKEVIVETNDYLSSLSEDVNKYYDNKWNALKANLKHKYFNSPWSACSVIAAAVLLLLTCTQTFYAVYGYYIPSS